MKQSQTKTQSGSTLEKNANTMKDCNRFHSKSLNVPKTWISYM